MRQRIARSLQEVRDHGRHLAELNIELLKAELKRATAKYGVAVGLFIGAAVFAFFGFSFLLATIAVALDIVLPLWAAMLIVTVLIFLLVIIMAVVGKTLITSVKSPAPGKAIAEAQASAQAAKEAARTVFHRRKKAADAAVAADTAAEDELAGTGAQGLADPPVSAPPAETESPEAPPSPTGGDRAAD